MIEFLSKPGTHLILMIALLAVLIVIGFYVVSRFRDGAEQKPSASELLNNFRELHSQGVLSDAEFRTIKTKLADQLQEELNDKGKTG